MKILFSLFLILTANFTYAQFSQEIRDRAVLQNLSKKLHEIANMDLKCETADECVVYTTGSRACGGPSDYVLTSVNNQYLPYVEMLSKQLTEKEREFNIRYNVISICSLVKVPAAVCEEEVCKVQ